MCSYCDKGFYRGDISNECKQCSACYNNDRDVFVEKYMEEKMPKNWQCFHTNREGRVCLT